MKDEELTRYSRHIMLPQLDYEGQLKLTQSRALIIGAGGLSSPVAMYLASSGIGHIIMSDFDHVELSNLQRQILHGNDDVGKAKVESAKETLQNLNSEIEITVFNEKLNEEKLREQIKQADVVLETTDNFESRFFLSRLCVEEKTPLVSGSAIRFEGQITVFRFDKADSPCYHCLYKETDEGEEAHWESCARSGVLAPVVGIIGSIQATEAIKVLTGIGKDLCGRLILFDALYMEWREMKLKKDPNCPVCSK
ncbi:MAG: molybdopterin-synthase adenylyltransferase MoeB [Pseudomonadota bacterium]